MIDQRRVTSKFHIELLLDEHYIKYLLLTSFETGSIPWWTTDTDPATGAVTNIIIHPPKILEEHRLYDPHPDFIPHPFLDQVDIVFTESTEACEVTLLPDEEEADIRVQMIVSSISPPIFPGGANVILLEQQMHIDSKFEVIADTDPNTGNQSNVRVKLELVDIGGPFIQLASGLPGFDKQRVLDNMHDQFDRDMPLAAFGEGGSLKRIASKKYFEDGNEPTCIGIYADLLLKSGPEVGAFFDSEGDLDLAQNFLPKNEHLAFAFAGDLYSKMASDVRQRMAVPKPGGGFSYPLQADDPGKGTINSVAVFPEGVNGGPVINTSLTGQPLDPALFANRLVIQVKGEYVIEGFFNPDFRMTIRLIPGIDDKHVLTFITDFDLNIPSLDWLIVGGALLGFLSLNAAIPITLALFAARYIVETTAEGEAIPIIKEQAGDPTLFDTLPNKLPAEIRRWDPAYSTEHQVVSLVQDVRINDQGMAFTGFDLRIGKEPKPLENAVIRSEVRDGQGNVSGLLYRINDWNAELAKDLDPIFPGTDRMKFEEILNPVGQFESFRVHLTVDQATERVGKSRLREKIIVTPYKIDEREHQIYQILTLSKTEVPEIRQRAKGLLRRELNQAKGVQFHQQAHDELLAELGREPTADEIEARFREILAAAVDAGVDKRFRAEREHFLKLDLEPFEYADLQQRKLLVLEHMVLQIVKVRDSAGGTVYYRDKPDRDKGDNLLFLPRYRSETIVRP